MFARGSSVVVSFPTHLGRRRTAETAALNADSAICVNITLLDWVYYM